MKRKNILINSKKINNSNNKVNTSYTIESNSNNNNVIFIVSYNNNNNNNNNLLCRFTALAYTTIQLFSTLVSFISHPVTNFSFFLLLKGFEKGFEKKLIKLTTKLLSTRVCRY